MSKALTITAILGYALLAILLIDAFFFNSALLCNLTMKVIGQ